MAVLALVELGVRLAPPRAMIPYGPGLEEHRAVASYLAAVGPADVGFIGSSMTRVGIDAPEIVLRLRQATGRAPYVANYGAVAGTAVETLAVVRYMLRVNATPRTLLLIEVSPRQLRPRPYGGSDLAAAYWNLADWWRAWRAGVPGAVDDLPEVLRNEIGEHYLTFRYRNRLSQWWHEHLLGEAALAAPMQGGRGKMSAARMDLSRLRPAQRQRRLTQWMRQNAIAAFAMDSRLVSDLDRALALCDAAHVPVALYEVPLSDDARRALPSGTMPVFHHTVRALAARHHVPLWTLARLGFVPRDSDFADVGHLDTRGSRRYTEALVEHVLLPRWREAETLTLPAARRAESLDGLGRAAAGGGRARPAGPLPAGRRSR